MVPIHSKRISKVWLDELKAECDKCCFCQHLCPDVFEVPDKMIVKNDADFVVYDMKIVEAAYSCPTQVIAIEYDQSGKRDYPLPAN